MPYDKHFMCAVHKRHLILAARHGRLITNKSVPSFDLEGILLRCDNLFPNFYSGENLGGCSRRGRVIRHFEDHLEYVLSPYGKIQLCLPCAEKIKAKTSAESSETELETEIEMLHQECKAYQTMSEDELLEEFTRRHETATMAQLAVLDDDSEAPKCPVQ